MRKLWDDRAWDDYLWWQSRDKKVLERINRLVKGLERKDEATIGKAERLKYGMAGLMSVRIDKENRLVYAYVDDSTLFIASCRGHYR